MDEHPTTSRQPVRQPGTLSEGPFEPVGGHYQGIRARIVPSAVARARHRLSSAALALSLVGYTASSSAYTYSYVNRRRSFCLRIVPVGHMLRAICRTPRAGTGFISKISDIPLEAQSNILSAAPRRSFVCGFFFLLSRTSLAPETRSRLAQHDERHCGVLFQA